MFDGHGGKETAREASIKLQAFLESQIRSVGLYPDFKACFEAAYARTDTHVASLPACKTSGAAAVTMIISKTGNKGHLYVANAGDCRAILSRRSRAVRLTHDHRTTDEAEKQRIIAAGGFVSEDRVQSVIRVTRAIGDPLLKQWIISNPHYVETDLGPSDSLVLLVGHSVWEVIDDQECISLSRGFRDTFLRDTPMGLQRPAT
jgi:serine/threonine protein phosphatase PrpC